MSWASYFNYSICKEIFAYPILVSLLYVCVILTCYLTDFSELDTCVCCSTCEGTNLVVFLSLFSKTFFSWFYLKYFFGLYNLFFFIFFYFYFVYPCPAETLRGSNCGFSHTLFYLLSFWDKKAEYFLFWTGIVFLTGQVIFVPKWPKWKFVSLWLAVFYWTKSLLCNDANYTGMLLYSESILQLWASRRLCAELKPM
jgi:hypothetical protein